MRPDPSRPDPSRPEGATLVRSVWLDPNRLTERLSIDDQQLIQIAKVISLDARVLVMDEPTAALSGVALVLHAPTHRGSAAGV